MTEEVKQSYSASDFDSTRSTDQTRGSLRAERLQSKANKQSIACGIHAQKESGRLHLYHAYSDSVMRELSHVLYLDTNTEKVGTNEILAIAIIRGDNK